MYTGEGAAERVYRLRVIGKKKQGFMWESEIESQHARGSKVFEKFEVDFQVLYKQHG